MVEKRHHASFRRRHALGRVLQRCLRPSNSQAIRPRLLRLSKLGGICVRNHAGGINNSRINVRCLLVPAEVELIVLQPNPHTKRFLSLLQGLVTVLAIDHPSESSSGCTVIISSASKEGNKPAVVARAMLSDENEWIEGSLRVVISVDHSKMPLMLRRVEDAAFLSGMAGRWRRWTHLPV